MNILSSLTRISSRCARQSLWFAGALLLGLGGSCVKEDESVIILGMPFLERNGDALVCEIKPGGSSYYQILEVDLSFNTGLVVPFEMQNNLLSVDPQTSNSGVDNSEMRMRSVDVKFSVPQVPKIEQDVRAINPNYVEFNLPLPANSFSGGGSKRTAFAVIPPDTMSKYRDAMIANGFSKGEPVQMELELRVHFDLTGGRGKIVSRSFRTPLTVTVGGLRKCLPTSWKDPAVEENAKVYELCTDKSCASSLPSSTAVCGNAQFVPQSPRCCDGPDAWKSIPNAPEICGVPR